MPVICSFDGIKIYIYFRDHAPPHIHAEYNGDWAIIAIKTGRVYRGYLPTPVLRLVREWLSSRRESVQEAWDRAERGEDPGRVAPRGKKGR